MAPGRDEAKRLIASDRVTVGGSSLIKPSTLVAESADIVVAVDETTWASRAGLKLAHAVDAFQLDLSDHRCLDVGASTGGFTDVMLSHDAREVVAVDVGYGQMIWRLREDPRVTVLDRTNFRTVDQAELGDPFDFIAVDVSFISVRLLATQLATAGAPDADYVVLVKPQFEVGKERVGRKGLVGDPADHRWAVETVSSALTSEGIGALGLEPSPILGSTGNREFLLHGRAGVESSLSNDLITEVTRA